MLGKMRDTAKSQKQKLIAMVEPPPPYGDTESVDNIADNRIQQRRNILNELDLIKTRVNQVIYTNSPSSTYIHIRM